MKLGIEMESLKNLPKERYLEEFKKLFLKSEKPSIGLQIAWDLGIFKTIFPEFKDFEKTQQHPVHHPEGNLWIHTKLTADKMAKLLADSDFNFDEQFILHLAILCHDLGKPSTTELIDGQWSSYGHDEAGEQPTRKFLEAIGVSSLATEKIVKLVLYHLKPVLLYNEKSKPAAVRRLARKLYPATIKELLLVSIADKGGRGIETDYNFADWILDRAKEYKVLEKPPEHIITGKELIALGLSPGPKMGETIKLLDDIHENFNHTKEQLMDIAKHLLIAIQMEESYD